MNKTLKKSARKLVVIVALAFVGSSSGFAQTFAEELRQEKLVFRQFQAARYARVSADEELKQVKRAYRLFMSAQRYAEGTATEAEETRELKRDFRFFLTEQNRKRLSVEHTP